MLFSHIGSSGRAVSRLVESRSATAAVHAPVRKASLCHFRYSRSHSLRLTEKVAARTQVPLARRRLRTVRAECRSRGLGQPTRYGQAGRFAQARWQWIAPAGGIDSAEAGASRSHAGKMANARTGPSRRAMPAKLTFRDVGHQEEG